MVGDSTQATPALLDRAGFDALLAILQGSGYTCIGPLERDGVIVLDELHAAAQLPAGWGDEQGPGRYRLHRRTDGAFFASAVGPHAWKRYLFPSEERLFQLGRSAHGFERIDAPPPPRKLALIGVRACDLRALQLQDQVFSGAASGGLHPDPGLLERRAAAFLVAVACTQPAETCFCASMGTGPQPGPGFDLCLTELAEEGPRARHVFVAEAGSPRGAQLLASLPQRPALPSESLAARAAVEAAAGRQTRRMDPGARALLAASTESPHWKEVAARCLACASCTLVCPTCFCTRIEDSTDLSGEKAERWRRWDSCFIRGFSYLHGGEVRASVAACYRQWLSHKLSFWHEQFGSAGCVGCGRCITWCPAGIDLTAEVAALRARAPAEGGKRP